jgi:hypothetical protein
MSTTSSSPKKRRTIVWSSARRGLARRVAAVCIVALTFIVPACRQRPRETLVMYFNAEFGLSLRYPASWQTMQATQESVWYRNFLAPPAGPTRKPAVSVTLFVGPLVDGLESHARVYLSDNEVLLSEDDVRPGLAGKHYEFVTPKEGMRHSLLLWRVKGTERLVGLYSQGEASFFEKNAPVIEEIERSLALERPADYRRHRNERPTFELGIPSSWRHARRLTSGGRYLEQWTSPALAAERNRQTVHASLTVSVEDIGDKGSLEAFYRSTREKLGDQYRVVRHVAWRDGWMDVMRVETPMAVSRVKRYYRVAGGRGYSLILEARADVYDAVDGWCDIIASTFKIGDEVSK